MDSRVEAIANSYIRQALGNPSLALRAAITYAMADGDDAERRALTREERVSRGYVRGCYDLPQADADMAETLLGGYGR